MHTVLFRMVTYQISIAIGSKNYYFIVHLLRGLHWITDNPPTYFLAKEAFPLSSGSAMVTPPPRVILDFQSFPDPELERIQGWYENKEARGEREFAYAPKREFYPAMPLRPDLPTVWLLMTGVSNIPRKSRPLSYLPCKFCSTARDPWGEVC